MKTMNAEWKRRIGHWIRSEPRIHLGTHLGILLV